MDFRPWVEKWLPAVVQPLGLSEAGKLIVKPLVAQRRAEALFRSTRRASPSYQSVASLLHPERSPVPFGYRDDDLRMLEDWCHDDSSGWVAWKLVTGETGRGKTRLLMRLVEVLRDMMDRRWRAGFLDMTALRADPGALLCFYHLPGDLLFVVDYAERFEAEVHATLKSSLALADAGAERRIRVVLISCRESELWQSIADSDMDIGDVMSGDGFSRYEPLPLGRDPSARKGIFDDAYAAFEDHFGEERPLAKRPDLSRRGFEEAILIHMAALSLHQGEISAGDVSEEALLDWVLSREKRHWSETIDKRDELPSSLKRAPIAQAAACLTLVSLGAGIRDRDQAIAGLRQCPLLSGVAGPALSAVADLFHDLYPGPGWVNGVTPDLIGTYLLNAAEDDFAASLMGGLSETEATNGLTKLNWVAQRWPESGRRKLESAIAANPARVIPLAVRVAVESGDPIGQIAAGWLQGHPDAALARSLAPEIPYPTTALRELAEVVDGILYAATVGDEEEAVLAERARLATNRAVRLSELGRREEALESAREAAELYRALVEARPDTFLPDLAASLSNLAVMLSELGHREEALERAREAAELYRALAEARPDVFRPDLALSLNNLANGLSDVGYREEALKWAREAAELYRALAEARPDALRPDLAMSLNNLARLSALGHREEALERAHEAAELYRALAEARPDAFRPYLAGSLNNLAAWLSALGHREEALERAREAVDIRRALVEARPDVFRPDLALSLNNLATMLSDLGHREEALERAREAVDIHRALAEARPDAFRPNLAMSLGTLTNCLTASGYREEALRSIQDGVATLQSLFLASPGAFAPLMAKLVSLYARLAEEMGTEPDATLLAPIISAFQSLESAPEDTAAED